MQKDVHAKLPHLQGYFWHLKWCAFISTERLYDRYWQKSPRPAQDMERGKSRGSFSPGDDGCTLEKSLFYTFPQERRIILRVLFVVWGCFFFQKEQNAFLCHQQVPLFFPKQPHCTPSARGSVFQPEQPWFPSEVHAMDVTPDLRAPSNNNFYTALPGRDKAPTQLPASYLPMQSSGIWEPEPVFPPEPFPAAMLSLVPLTLTL